MTYTLNETIARVAAKRTKMLHQWHTPATDYPLLKQGRVEIVREPAQEIIYAEGVRGYLFIVTDDVQITCLEINGRVWMCDEPQYVWCLESFARRSHGNVLVAGLGLGLVVHYLLRNHKVTGVTVIERERDVIAAIKPLLPKSKRLKIVERDFYSFLKGDSQKRDTVIWDLGLWGGMGSEEAHGKDELAVVPALAAAQYGYGVTVFRHGFDRDPVGTKYLKEHRAEFLSVQRAFR